MARHGGNVTGVSILATELDAKRLEILRAALPSAKLVGLIADPGNSAERHPGRRCRGHDHRGARLDEQPRCQLHIRRVPVRASGQALAGESGVALPRAAMMSQGISIATGPGLPLGNAARDPDEPVACRDPAPLGAIWLRVRPKTQAFGEIGRILTKRGRTIWLTAGQTDFSVGDAGHTIF
jgi:hypothetical protein